MNCPTACPDTQLPLQHHASRPALQRVRRGHAESHAIFLNDENFRTKKTTYPLYMERTILQPLGEFSKVICVIGELFVHVHDANSEILCPFDTVFNVVNIEVKVVSAFAGRRQLQSATQNQRVLVIPTTCSSLSVRRAEAVNVRWMEIYCNTESRECVRHNRHGQPSIL